MEDLLRKIIMLTVTAQFRLHATCTWQICIKLSFRISVREEPGPVNQFIIIHWCKDILYIKNSRKPKRKYQIKPVYRLLSTTCTVLLHEKWWLLENGVVSMERERERNRRKPEVF
jgi:hypothetical protein